MTHAAITGASSGIGRAIAAQLLQQGVSVTVIASRPGPLDAAAESLRAMVQAKDRAPVQIGKLCADVRDAPALSVGLLEAERQRGPIASLITSAGVVRPGAFEDLPAEEFRRQMDINYLGTVNAVRAVWPAMVERRSGRIGMIASAAWLKGIFGYTAYAPTKFAIRGFAEALRSEARPYGIGVTVCYPPDTDTPQLAAEIPERPLETQAIAGTAGVVQPETVARDLLAAMARGRFNAFIGVETKALGWVGSLVSPVLDWHFDRQVAAVNRRNRG